MNDDEPDLRTFLAQRLQVQGPDHPEVIRALTIILRAGLSADESRQDAEFLAGPVPVDELPEGVDPDSIRLEGDHTERLADAVSMAVELQERETQAFGPDHPRALMSTVLLAHALAAANQMDGQIETTRALVEDARDGLLETEGVNATDRAIAETVHHWVLDQLGEDPTY